MLVTPFEADGRIDLDTLAHLVHTMDSWGLAAISALGFGAEALSLDRQERAVVGRTVVGAAGRLPTIIGCTAATLHETLELTRDAADLGAAAVMVAPPTQERVGGAEMIDAYVKLARMVQPVTVMIQDAPRWSTFALSAQLVSEVQHQAPNVTLAKPESTPAADAVADLAQLGTLAIFGGAGGLHMLDQKEAGAVGVIPGCDVADVLNGIYTLHDEDPDAARALFERILPLLVLQFQTLESFVLASKLILVERGLIPSAKTRIEHPAFGPSTRRLLLLHAARAGVIPARMSDAESENRECE